MKLFNIDLEAADASKFKDGMADVMVKVTVQEIAQQDSTYSSLNMSEKTMRRLHKMLGNHIRHLDENKERI